MFDSEAARARRRDALPVEHAVIPWTKKEREALRNTAAALRRKGPRGPSSASSSLDWDLISCLNEARVLRMYPVRTAAACRFEWEENVSPSATKTKKWEKDDDKRLVEAATQYGGRNWAAIALAVGGGRTPFACFSRYQRQFRSAGCLNMKRWSAKEDEQLLRVTAQCGTCDWSSVAGFFKGTRSKEACSSRWHLLVQREQPQPSPWSVDENRMLTLAVHAFPKGDWVSVSACVPTRTRHQCKQHWAQLKEGASEIRAKSME